MSRVTIKDVAREAGVSPSAVSRVFTTGASASPLTRERVLAAADRLGYRPSLLARGLVGRSTHLVTVIMGSLSDPFDALFLDALARALAARDTRLMIASTAGGAPTESGLQQALDYKSDAVIVAAGTMSLADSALCARAGLPVILAGRALEAPGVDGVLADNADGGRQAADLLMRTACHRPAYLGLGKTTFSDRERWQGFADTLARLGAKPAEWACEGRDPEAAFRAASAVLSAPHRPDGLFCSNDAVALRAVEAARALGLSVPEDVSIIGFNNLPQAAWPSFQLSTLDYPIGSLVGAIIDLLDTRLADPQRSGEVRRLPVHLVPRATTRRADVGVPASAVRPVPINPEAL
ncbi:LacI family DNA-binding transcriptional regulator [uncultured Rhodospira sp.]|mgnify:CR=1 FL=1|uniref:LacI family DNA-binding transcriptional regulator n=1 Tax=uncultured Rhodospira sp. TaxID=1936189 RepID=UPI002619A470|nr:LacI family DNA-binding transcriptional regulator [uncultured Rhodospira sp.]